MLEDLKKEVIRIAQDAQRSGLCKHKSGNFSIRDKETGYIVITPSAVDRELLTPDMISVLDQDLNLIEGLKASSESMMHAECYKVNPDCYGIAHTHSKMGTAFSVLNKPIPAIIYEVASFRLDDGTIPVAPYGRPGTVELAKNVAETSKKADMMLMEKHGVIALGKDLENAYLAVQYIEELAEIYFDTLLINKGVEPPYFHADELSKWKYPEQLGKK